MKFWLFALIGAGLVVGYSLSRAGGTLHPADLALFGSIVCAGVSYAEEQGCQITGRAAGHFVGAGFSFPILIIPAIHYAPVSLNLPLESWLGFIYLTVISQYLGFFPWYHGLALGGIAK